MIFTESTDQPNPEADGDLDPAVDDSSVGSADVEGVAQELYEATTGGGWIRLPSETVDDLDWDRARAVARRVDELRVDGGDRPIGYKLGWTSSAMREALGIERPNWGTLWASQQLDTGEGFSASFDVGLLRHPKVEPELVYRAGSALAGADVTADDVLAAADRWALGLEVVHPRFESFDFTWLDNTADNSSAQAIVVGGFDAVRDPAEVTIEFARTERTEQSGPAVELRNGTGSLAMGSPAEAVAWLVGQLAAEGQSVRAGDIVFTGGLAKPYDVVAGSTFRVSSPGLNPVELAAPDR